MTIPDRFRKNIHPLLHKYEAILDFGEISVPHLPSIHWNYKWGLSATEHPSLQVYLKYILVGADMFHAALHSGLHEC